MSNKLIISISLLLIPIFFSGCSDDDKETARVKVAAVGLPHNPSQCPEVDGVYKRKEGLSEGALAFTITDDGSRLQFVSKATGLDGHTFILDGKYHEETENDRIIKYAAGCDNGKLAVVGSIGDGAEQIDMTISSEGVSVSGGSAAGKYSKVVGP